MKRKARVSFLLAFIMLVAFLLAPSTHAQDPVTVYTFIDGAVWHANDDQPIRLYFAWVAMTKGQVNQFLVHHENAYLMTEPGEGEPLLDLDADEAEQYWGPIFSLPSDTFGWDCPMPTPSAAEWEYTVGPLDPGTYTLMLTLNYNNPVNDGVHVCTFSGSDVPLVPPPSLYTEDDSFVATSTIVVSAQ